VTAPGEAPRDERGGELGAPDGALLRYRVWDAAGEPRAAVLLVHGLGDHSGRYAGLARALAGRRITVAAVDLRGHGRSAGRRGHVASFAEYLGDVEAFRREVVRSLPPGLPLFLLGHSMGGLVALRYLQTHPDVPFRGAILSAPALDLVEAVPAWKRALAAVLSRAVPVVPFPNGIDANDLTRDPEAAAAYRADPLVHDRITPRLYREMRAAMQAARAHRDAVRTPLFFLLPGSDRIVHTPAALAYAEGRAERVRTYPGFYHESFNEPERAAVFAEVAEWIEAKTA